MYIIGSGGICKTAFDPVSAAAGAPQLRDENGDSRFMSKGQWGVPQEAAAGALLGGAGAYGAYKGLRYGLGAYGMRDRAMKDAVENAGGLKKFRAAAKADKGLLEKTVANAVENGSGQMRRAGKISRFLGKAKLPLAGLGVAAGAALAAHNAEKHNAGIA